MLNNAKKYLFGLIASAALLPAISSAATDDGGSTSATISISTDLISPDTVESPLVALSGAWVNSAVGPSLTNKGVLYTLNIPVLGTVPSGSTITTVNYKWGLSTVPSGLAVYLCWNTTSSCVNVSSSQTGSLGNFAGLDANKKFIFAFTVPGSGSIFPVAYGQSDQVIVNYN